MSIRERLMDIERVEVLERSCYKFGVLYMKPGQEMDENLIYSNVTQDTSKEYQEFLNFMGEIVELEGWSKFLGGLTVKATSKSLYTMYQGKEIMFHVATMLPFCPTDEQQIERKRHLGNDITILIFKEPGVKVDVTIFFSFFTHVYIVIEPFTELGQTFYKIACANKRGVVPYGPYIPKPNILPKNEETRAFILSKLINSQRAAILSPSFRNRMEVTRSSLLATIASKVTEELQVPTQENVKKTTKSAKPTGFKLSFKRDDKRVRTQSRLSLPLSTNKPIAEDTDKRKVHAVQSSPNLMNLPESLDMNEEEHKEDRRRTTSILVPKRKPSRSILPLEFVSSFGDNECHSLKSSEPPSLRRLVVLKRNFTCEIVEISEVTTCLELLKVVSRAIGEDVKEIAMMDSVVITNTVMPRLRDMEMVQVLSTEGSNSGTPTLVRRSPD
eukprot:TRINITY_DN7666_c0_g2_i6.p1 TRINITY_DN7666_c0_g2~~TRINITY_DN7666_c0_g2_i6.p1  ORF type:complete len:442 (-),score=85.55 TRINITY_DN7666_c0_g2_i6:123-1448(-)